MPAHPSSKNTPPALRKRAEDVLRVPPPDILGMSTGELQKLLHELQVHQIELKIQNEELLLSQAELAQSSDRYTDLYDFAPVGYISFDDEYRVTEANLTMANMLGVSRDKIVGHKFTRFVARLAQDTLYLHQQATLNSADRQACDILLRRMNGKTFYARMETVCHPATSTSPRNYQTALIDITERKHAEEQLTALNSNLEQEVFHRTQSLQESEGRFRQVMEAIQKVFWMTDVTKNTMIYVSPAYERIWGRSCQSLYDAPHTWLEAIHPDDRPLVIKAARKDQITGRYDIEYRIIRPDGTERWVRDRAFPIRDTTGEVYRIAGLADDITDRKKAEMSLRLFRTLVDRSDDTFEIIDPETARFLDVNEKGCLELGVTREEYLSLRVMDIDPTITEENWPALVVKIQTEGSQSGEGIHRRKDGTVFPIEFNACWVPLDRNYIVTVVRDITDRRKATRSFEETRLRLAGLVESAMDAIISIDDAQRINLFNRAAEKMFLCPASEAIGSTIDRFIPGRFHTAETGRMHRLGEMDSPHPAKDAPATISGLRTDGESFLIEGTYSEVEIAGKMLSTLILRDITHRIRNEAALHRQAQLLHLSHDAIFVWSTLKGVEYWNQGAMKLYGFSSDELMGRVPHEDLKTIYGVPWSQIESELHECSVWEGTLHQKTKDGEDVVVATRMQMISEDKAKGLVILESNRDITDRQRLEEELIRANERERQRIGSDLHDGLGQEMTGISLLNNVLQNRLKMKEAPEAAIAKQLATLLKNACDEVRRLSHGLQPVSSDSESLMEGLRTLVSGINLLKGAVCVFRHDEPVVKVHNHEFANHLYRIAQEAMQNALRHGKPQKVMVSLTRKDERIILEIKDDGIGFEPKKTKHHGIGLRTMKYRAELMNGNLQVIQLPEGGTLVHCSVPDPQQAPQDDKTDPSAQSIFEL